MSSAFVGNIDYFRLDFQEQFCQEHISSENQYNLIKMFHRAYLL